MSLIVFACGFVLGALAVSIIKRRFNTIINSDRIAYEAKIESQRLAIRSMIYGAHHNSANSNLKTIRGLISVYRLEGSRLTARLKSLGALAWAEAVAFDFVELDKKYLTEIENQCIEGEKKIIENVSRFNDLQ